jgi:hypothetical protein
MPQESFFISSPCYSEAPPLLQRSKSIPIKRGPVGSAHISDQEEALNADWRDYVIFHRITMGITKGQERTVGLRTRMVNDMCLASLIGTRNLSDEELMRFDHKGMRRQPALLRSYGRQENLVNLSSFPDAPQQALPPSSSIDEEAIFDLEL